MPPTMTVTGKYRLTTMASLSEGAAKYEGIVKGVNVSIETVLDKTDEALAKVARDVESKELTPRGAHARRVAIGDVALKELERIRQERIRSPQQDIERNALPGRIEPLPAEKDALDADPGVLGFVRDRLGRLSRDEARAAIEQAARDGETTLLLAVQHASVRKSFGVDDAAWSGIVAGWAERTRPETAAARRAAQEAIDAVGISISAARDWVVQKTGATRDVPVPNLTPPRIS